MLNKGQPLWLPPGSVRAILALGVVGAFLAGQIEADIALLVLGSYFVGRQNPTPSVPGSEDV